MSKTLLNQNINMIWASLIIDELIKNSICKFFVSPGNRNAPLISALAYNNRAVKITSIDERAAGYMALGHAKATGTPGVLVCTSGTALSNYYPSVIEAFRDCLPMIIISADRPPELTGSDANQTIDQINIFGKFCLDNLNLPCPTEEYPLRALLSKISHLVNIKEGPVHINCRFRDPLIPEINSGKTISKAYIEEAKSIFDNDSPLLNYSRTKRTPESLSEINRLLNKTERGILIIGRLHPFEDKKTLLDFSEKLKWPLFCDIGSSLKFSTGTDSVIPFLDHPEIIRIINDYSPHTILHLGYGLVSKHFYENILKKNKTAYIQVNPGEKLQDPAHRLNYKVTAQVSEFIKKVEIAHERPLDHAKRDQLLDSINLVNLKLKETAVYNSLTFPLIADIITSLIPDGSALFLGNSLTVREFDRITLKDKKDITVVANRGVSGIEGSIATSIGYADSSGKRTTSVLGDVAFLHDMNSLIYFNNTESPLILIIINNGGGRIFERLPVKSFPKILDPLMLTPHNYSFKLLAEQFGIPYYFVSKPDELNKNYEIALQKNDNALIEVILANSDDLDLFYKRNNIKITYRRIE